MSELVFSIKNLHCRYPEKDHAALVIEELEVFAGEIVFVVGSSGLGKSTFLETLGLMTKTVMTPENSLAHFYFRGETDLLKAWRLSDRYRSVVRQKHFSFIFQNTNLLSNLSPLENVMITSVLQGMNLESAKRRASAFLAKLFSGLDPNKMVSKLSGGERQRLAFARAMSCDYSILFADEPTGNLDMANSNILMGVLINEIDSSGKTAIVVSHSLELALEYATKIVWIYGMKIPNREKNEQYGRISSQSVFRREKGKPWLNSEGLPISKEHLEARIQTPIESGDVS